MTVISIILLVFRIMIQLPHMVKVGREIIELVKKLKDGGFAEDLLVVLDILKLILGLTKVDKPTAGSAFYDLRGTIQGFQAKESFKTDLSSLRDKVQSQHEAAFSASDIKGE